jgi:hypothetical protein
MFSFFVGMKNFYSYILDYFFRQPVPQAVQNLLAYCIEHKALSYNIHFYAPLMSMICSLSSIEQRVNIYTADAPAL